MAATAAATGAKGRVSYSFTTAMAVGDVSSEQRAQRRATPCFPMDPIPISRGLPSLPETVAVTSRGVIALRA